MSGSVDLVVLRHGPTEWTQDGRIQGRSDVPLSAAGAAQVRGWRLPSGVDRPDRLWLTSPLSRAVATARLLGLEPQPEPRLVEMDWGEWSGRRLEELRALNGARMEDWEARGLDFRPPGGESPRAVQRRIEPWLAEAAAGGRPVGAVTHKGVLRALYALAVGWDMTGRPPDRLSDGCAHRFVLDAMGRPRVLGLNLPLRERVA